MVLQFSYFAIHISAQQSAQVEPVSGTSGVGYKRLPPTTSQQDQSALKKYHRILLIPISGNSVYKYIIEIF
jgi:cytidylate kinase